MNIYIIYAGDMHGIWDQWTLTKDTKENLDELHREFLNLKIKKSYKTEFSQTKQFMNWLKETKGFQEPETTSIWCED